MKKTIRNILPFAFVLAGCCKAGLDGEATMVVFPQHHGRPILSHSNYLDTAYIKFNTSDLPSDPTHNYDAIFVGNVGEDHVHCTNVKCGKYYIYCTGFDTTINQRVTGGMAYKLKYSDRKKEEDINVAVTE